MKHPFVMYNIGEDRCGRCLQPRAAQAHIRASIEADETDLIEDDVCESDADENTYESHGE